MIQPEPLCLGDDRKLALKKMRSVIHQASLLRRQPFWRRSVLKAAEEEYILVQVQALLIYDEIAGWFLPPLPTC